MLQRPHELESLAEEWLGRRPGRDLPAVYVEHNAPQGRIADMRHPAADRDDLLLVHVTHFNALFWDAGTTRTRVDRARHRRPGRALQRRAAARGGRHQRGAARARVTGTDLLEHFAEAAPLDVFGIDADAVGRRSPTCPQDRLHDEMARRRVYVHPIRWTSLGLSLLEAMHLGMPVVALGTTEVHEAVPPEAGVVSTKLDVLAGAVRRLVADPDEAAERGRAARTAVLERYGLARFLSDWDDVLAEVTA